ncbi:unnamed protein product [Leptosia nina]|uniref:Secreted protein n=1 Tax=Leptosia nina TaxID=320188 RepID=A0AAV1K0N1_9NEOP
MRATVLSFTLLIECVAKCRMEKASESNACDTAGSTTRARSLLLNGVAKYGEPQAPTASPPPVWRRRLQSSLLQ